MEKVEQIDILGNKVIEYDEKVKSSEYKNIFESAGLEIEEEAYHNRKKIYKTIVGDKKFILLPASVTYLGNPHPIFKKRVQIKNWWLEVFNKYKNEYEVLFIGIYKFEDNIIFIDFNTEKYINNKLNNSSAHVYTNDLYQSMNSFNFLKKDKNNNKINLIRRVYFKEYLRDRNSNIIKSENKIIEIIEQINNKFPFNQELKGEDCYKTMIDNNYSKKFEPEWAGYYLEYIYENELNFHPEKVLKVYNGGKAQGELDFDLYSHEYNFYSDLKASDIKQKETPLNDQLNVIKALEKTGKIWYIIYQHDTIKDSEVGNIVCKYWNNKQNEILNKNKKMDSYGSRMKGRIKFKNMIILEVNKINSSSILREFNQGKNSNGKERKLKYKIKKSEIENFVIYRYGEK